MARLGRRGHGAGRSPAPRGYLAGDRGREGRVRIGEKHGSARNYGVNTKDGAVGSAERFVLMATSVFNSTNTSLVLRVPSFGTQ